MHNRDRYFTENEKWYRDLVLETLTLIKEKDLIVEVNTRGIYKKRSTDFYPATWLLPIMKDMNVPVVSTGARLLDGLAEAVRVMGYKEALSPEAYRRQLEKLLRSGGLGSSSARLSRAYHIWNTGTLLNSKNLLVAKDLDKVDAVLYALGFDRLEDIYSYRLKLLRMDEPQRHAELVNDMGPDMLDEFRAGNYDEAYDIFALYTSNLSDYEKGLIHRKVMNYLRKHLGDTVLQQIEKETFSARLSEQAKNAIELERKSHK
jgi:hypothetical protein